MNIRLEIYYRNSGRSVIETSTYQGKFHRGSYSAFRTDADRGIEMFLPKV